MKYSWTEIYQYYFSMGLLCYILNSISSIIVGSVISIAPIFLFGCLQYKPIKSVTQISDIILPFKEGFHNTNLLMKTCSFVFLLYPLFLLYQFLSNLPKYIRLHFYFHKTLKITDRDLSAIIWNDVVEIVLLHEENESRTILSVAQEILRNENYLIALITDPSLLTMRYPFSKKSDRIPMSRFFFYIFHVCLSGIVLDSEGCSCVNGVNKIHNMKAAQQLKTRFRIFGFFLFILSPFILSFQLLFLVFHYAQAIKNSPGTLSLRRWTPLSKWIIREYNELPHLLSERIRKSYMFANFYFDLFPSPLIRPLSRIGYFLSGGLLAIFFVFGLITDSGFLLTIPVFGNRTLAWLMSIVATIYGICHMIAPSEERPFDPDEALEQVEKHIHYDFRGQNNSARSWETYDNLCKFFQPIYTQLFSELFSVLMNPFLFGLILPAKSQSIVSFVEKNSVPVSEIGWICAFSAFEESNNIKGQVPEMAEKLQRSINFFNDKMEHQGNLIDFNSSVIMPDENAPLLETPNYSSQDLLNDFANPNEFKDNELIYW